MPVKPQKMFLGLCPCSAIRLFEAGPVLLIAEGVEDGLSATQASGYPSWAAGSKAKLTRLELSEGVGQVVVLADRDGLREAKEAARQWRKGGKRVGIVVPPKGDWNDMLVAGRSADIAGMIKDALAE